MHKSERSPEPSTESGQSSGASRVLASFRQACWSKTSLPDGALISSRRPLTRRPHQPHTRTARIPARHSAPHRTPTAQASTPDNRVRPTASTQDATPGHTTATAPTGTPPAQGAPRAAHDSQHRDYARAELHGQSMRCPVADGGTRRWYVCGVVCRTGPRPQGRFTRLTPTFPSPSHRPTDDDVGAPMWAHCTRSQDAYHTLPRTQMPPTRCAARARRGPQDIARARCSPTNRANVRYALSNARGTAPSHTRFV